MLELKWTAEDFAAAPAGLMPMGKAADEWTVGDIDAVLPQNGGVDLAKVQSMVKPVADSDAALQQAKQELAAQDPSGYVGSLKVRYRDLQAKVDDAASAISVADRALYVAKASGRNAWVGFHPGITALPIQGLFAAICHGTQQLVRDGTLRVSSSLTGLRNLVWDTPARDTVANG